jgi:hypothetical protein
MRSENKDSDVEILNLLFHAAEEVVGNGKVLLIPYGSLGYVNPLFYDEFPFNRVNDLEAMIIYETNTQNSEIQIADEIMKKFGQHLARNGYKTEETDLGIGISFPDGRRRVMAFCGRVRHFDSLKKTPLPISLFTNQLYGGNEALKNLRKFLDSKKIEKEDVLDHLFTHYLFLYSDAKDFASKGNYKFYKRIAEMSKYRGERPEIRDAILKKHDEWERYITSGGKIEGKVLDKLQGEWNAISIDHGDFETSKVLIYENLMEDENRRYKLRFD